jgi:hypothetical protein
MDDAVPYPSEGERAVKATILGVLLGLILATLARRSRLA